jgi:acetoin utilization deacetylase AcuC-like enzyme
MSHVRLYDNDYRWVSEQLGAVAKQHSKGRIVSVLEGGYDLSSLGRSVAAHINGLIGH